MATTNNVFNEKSISPKETNPQVERLLDVLNAEMEIVKVEADPAGKLNNCYYNVLDKVKRDGGKIHYGWVVWQSSYLVEAEHHAVWEDDEENLLDITPRKEHYDTIMFVPDNEKVFDGNMAVPNVRLNTTNNGLIDHFIIYSRVIDKLTGLGTRINDESLSIPEPIVEAINGITICRNNTLMFYAEGNTTNSKCFCGSSKTYIKCHGEGIEMLEDGIMKKAKLLIKNNP